MKFKVYNGPRPSSDCFEFMRDSGAIEADDWIDALSQIQERWQVEHGQLLFVVREEMTSMGPRFLRGKLFKVDEQPRFTLELVR